LSCALIKKEKSNDVDKTEYSNVQTLWTKHIMPKSEMFDFIKSELKKPNGYVLSPDGTLSFQRQKKIQYFYDEDGKWTGKYRYLFGTYISVQMAQAYGADTELWCIFNTRKFYNQMIKEIWNL